MKGDYKTKPYKIMLRKTSTFVKSYDGQTKWTYILIKHDDVLNKYNIICDKSVLIFRKNLIANLSTKNIFE